MCVCMCGGMHMPQHMNGAQRTDWFCPSILDHRDQSQDSGDKHLYNTDPSCQSKSPVSVNCVSLLSILAPAPAFCTGPTSFLKLTAGLRSVQRYGKADDDQS